MHSWKTHIHVNVGLPPHQIIAPPFFRLLSIRPSPLKLLIRHISSSVVYHVSMRQSRSCVGTPDFILVHTWNRQPVDHDMIFAKFDKRVLY